MPPKAALRKDSIRRYELRLAERLGKTLKELEATIGVGEIAEWIAHDELTFEYSQSREQQTYDAGKALHRR